MYSANNLYAHNKHFSFHEEYYGPILSIVKEQTKLTHTVGARENNPECMSEKNTLSEDTDSVEF